MNPIDLNLFLEWIRQINGGNVIAGEPDKTTTIPLPGEDVVLYRQPLANGAKYFFFANLRDTQDIESTISAIENITIHTRDQWCDGKGPKPSDSYMVYFWKISEFTEEVSKQIIKLEENEFTYKKYVFYYTKSESDAFADWLRKKTVKAINKDIIQTIENENLESNEMQFLLRLLIKVPCISLSFKASELPDYDQLVTQYIMGIQNDSQQNSVQTMNETIVQSLKENLSAEEIADIIIDEFEG